MLSDCAWTHLTSKLRNTRGDFGDSCGRCAFEPCARATAWSVADVVVDGELLMGIQQQHLVRSSELKRGSVGTYMNCIHLGAQTHDEKVIARAAD